MARSRFDAEDRPIESDPAAHRSRIEVERFACALEDFAVEHTVTSVKALYETKDFRRFVVEYENGGQSTDKPEIKEFEL